MKKLLLLAASVFMMMSCATANLAATQETQPKQPTRTVREKNPCEIKAEEPSENLRAVGMARSYNESVLRSNAINNAQIQLAQMLRASIEGAIEEYGRDVNSGVKVDSEGITERLMTSYLSQDIKNTKVIESIMFDLSDGSIQMYVCVEMGKSSEALTEDLSNSISEDEVLGIEFNKQRFKESISKGLEEYKKQIASER